MNDRHQKTAYPLRMPDDLRTQLEKSAHEVGRSLNSEIVARLQQTFSSENTFTGPTGPVIVQNFDDLMTEFMRRYNITMESPVALKPQPEFSDQADDMPIDPPKRRVKLHGKLK
jgi:hypothetical protein